MPPTARAWSKVRSRPSLSLHEGLAAGGEADRAGRARRRHGRSICAGARRAWSPCRPHRRRATSPSSPPVISALPSSAGVAARMAPAWTRVSSAAGPEARRTVPSPSAKTAVSPRKAVSTTKAPKSVQILRWKAIASACRQATQASRNRPSSTFSSRWRPMKTSRLWRISSSFHGRWWLPSMIMWTPCTT